jgi:hypothetical protein
MRDYLTYFPKSGAKACKSEKQDCLLQWTSEADRLAESEVNLLEAGMPFWALSRYDD